MRKWWRIPVRAALDLHIHADRRLAFEVLTAFDASAPGSEGSSKVLRRDDNGVLCEFHTPGKGLFWRPKVYRTVEYVTSQQPEWIEFNTVEGPLASMRDRFDLEDERGCTRLRFGSEFTMAGSVVGWLVGVLVVRPELKRMIRGHLQELKQTMEARAARSRVYPRYPCGEPVEIVNAS